jgi:hypothetical protein
VPEEIELTVRIDGKLVDAVKDYAASHNTTVSRLISEYFQTLAPQYDLLAEAPILRRLTGLLPSNASIKDYHSYLEQKYGK